MTNTAPFSTRCMTDADWTKVRYFKKSEFKNPDKMGFEFILWLDKVRDITREPSVVTSDYRTHQHNVDVGGAQNSAHEDVPCDAVDLIPVVSERDPHGNLWRFATVEAAMHLGCNRIGIYPNGSLHLDMTADRRPAPRLWIQVDNPAHS